ncbi:MAG: hypothetical protein HRU71_13975 [Planctomycetia bacterium]|nr:MAG: hypothetical protein HRU71_13975 [Planctomycetia bacterium]RIK67398.1 MAG: hypothetical protein DCC66_11860 [Planctomycetota bacterium]
MKFEHKSQPLVPFARFVIRLLRAGALAAGIVFVSLGIGVVGYHYFERLPWIDALLNASMILGGMGPVDQLKTTGGKLFASAYALFSGVVFLTVSAVLFGPVVHRLLHRFHLDRK